jgi:hypothetical protein
MLALAYSSSPDMDMTMASPADSTSDRYFSSDRRRAVATRNRPFSDWKLVRSRMASSSETSTRMISEASCRFPFMSAISASTSWV